MWKTFIKTQQDLAEAGFFIAPTVYGFYTYFDQEQYKNYLKKETDNESN